SSRRRHTRLQGDWSSDVCSSDLMILYQLLRMSFAGQVDGLDVSVLWFLPAMLFPCAAAYRLAKFNIDETQQYGFKGVPTPAAGRSEERRVGKECRVRLATEHEKE